VLSQSTENEKSGTAPSSLLEGGGEKTTTHRRSKKKDPHHTMQGRATYNVDWKRGDNDQKKKLEGKKRNV